MCCVHYVYKDARTLSHAERPVHAHVEVVPAGPLRAVGGQGGQVGQAGVVCPLLEPDVGQHGGRLEQHVQADDEDDEGNADRPGQLHKHRELHLEVKHDKHIHVNL